MGRPDRAAQLLARRVLEQVARGARLERGHDVGVRVVRRQHEHARRIAELAAAGGSRSRRRRRACAGPSARRRAGAPRRASTASSPSPASPDHLVQRIAGEHAAQPVAHDRVVVDDQQPDRRRRRSPSRRRHARRRPDRRQPGRDRGPAAGLGLDRERARQPAEPLAHRREAEAGPGLGRPAAARRPPGPRTRPRRRARPASRRRPCTTASVRRGSRPRAWRRWRAPPAPSAGAPPRCPGAAAARRRSR